MQLHFSHTVPIAGPFPSGTALCRGILAPLLPSSQEALLGAADSEDGDEPEEGVGKDEEVSPVITVTASKKGSNLEADLVLASFACNLMVEPIKVMYLCL